MKSDALSATCPAVEADHSDFSTDKIYDQLVNSLFTHDRVISWW